MNTMPRPQFLPDGVDPTLFDADKLGVKQPAGCWKWIALAALPLGLCLGGGGVAALAVRSIPTPTPNITATPAKSGTPLPTPTKTPIPLPVTATPGNIPINAPTAAATQCYLFYRVRSGQTLTDIAKLWNVSTSTILKLNGWIKNPSVIQANQWVKLPFCLPSKTPEG